MRLRLLEIEGYKMFDSKSVFEFNKDLHILIGVNGSGKSTIIEAIAIIFDRLKSYYSSNQKTLTPFDFKIEYSFVKNTVLEETSTTQETTTSIDIVSIQKIGNDEAFSIEFIVNDEPVDSIKDKYNYLPDNLIYYYAGFCETLNSIVTKNEQEAAESLYGLKDINDAPSFLKEITKSQIYIREVHFPILFLLNYLDRDGILKLTNKSFSIETIKLFFKKPPTFSNNDYADLYNLQGLLREFVLNLLPYSQPMKEIREERKHSGFELELEYHRGLLEAVENLPGQSSISRFSNTRYYAFHLLNLLYHIGLLSDITITIKDEEDNLYPIRQLSEGEQQLITIEAINKVLAKDNTILFFDEPDSFLHPQRQREILPYIEDQFQDRFSQGYAQLIITTHSPFVAQSIGFENIILFDEFGKVLNNKNVVLDTEAINEVLFGVRERFNEEIEEKLRAFKIIRNKIIGDKDYDKPTLIEIVSDLQSYGEETRVIVARELAQLNRLKGFDING